MLKLLPLAALALAVTAGAAVAENTFTLDGARSTASALSLKNVQADQAGRIEVYAIEDGQATRLLGTAPVAAGATGTVDVALNQANPGRIQVLLSNGNRNVATLESDVLTN